MLKLLPDADSKYLAAYLGFIKIEIPSILQILTLLTLISFFGNSYILSLLLLILIYLLTYWYLNEKLLVFLNNELKYYIPNQERLDRRNTILLTLLTYNGVISLIVSLTLGAISAFIFYDLFTSSINHLFAKTRSFF